MLADDDVDAVVVATGRNWRALATIWSCQAGKGVCRENTHPVFMRRPVMCALARCRVCIIDNIDSGRRLILSSTRLRLVAGIPPYIYVVSSCLFKGSDMPVQP